MAPLKGRAPGGTRLDQPGPAPARTALAQAESIARGSRPEESNEVGAMQSRVLSVVAIVIVLTGVGSLMFLFFSGNSTPSNQIASTTGTVIRCETMNNSGSFNVVSFQVKGMTYSALTRVGTRYPCVYTVGQKVTVTYDPNNPSSASVSNGGPFNGIEFGSLLIPFLGFCVLSTVIAIFRRGNGRGSTTVVATE